MGKLKELPEMTQAWNGIKIAVKKVCGNIPDTEEVVRIYQGMPEAGVDVVYVGTKIIATGVEQPVRKYDSVTKFNFQALVRLAIMAQRLGIVGEVEIAEPLKIRDLENATTTIRTANNNGWPENDPTWNITFWEATLQYDSLGWIALDNNQEWYVDGIVCEPLGSIVMVIGTVFSATPLSIDEGNIVRLTYDGGQELNVYLPAIRERTSLYVASDGSTYYDEALTQLAQAAA